MHEERRQWRQFESQEDHIRMALQLCQSGHALTPRESKSHLLTKHKLQTLVVRRPNESRYTVKKRKMSQHHPNWMQNGNNENNAIVVVSTGTGNGCTEE